jgi:hypothetical protein
MEVVENTSQAIIEYQKLQEKGRNRANNLTNGNEI